MAIKKIGDPLIVGAKRTNLFSLSCQTAATILIVIRRRMSNGANLITRLPSPNLQPWVWNEENGFIRSIKNLPHNGFAWLK